VGLAYGIAVLGPSVVWRSFLYRMEQNRTGEDRMPGEGFGTGAAKEAAWLTCSRLPLISSKMVE
jgi:hypothetical protein